MKHDPCPCGIYTWKNKGLYIYIPSYFLNTKYYVIKSKFENVFHSILLSLSSFSLFSFDPVCGNFSSRNRDGTLVLQWELRVLNTGLPGNCSILLFWLYKALKYFRSYFHPVYTFLFKWFRLIFNIINSRWQFG